MENKVSLMHDQESIVNDITFTGLKQVEVEYKRVVRLNIVVWLLIVLAGFGFLSFILSRANDSAAYFMLLLIPIVPMLFALFYYPGKVYKYTHYGLLDEVFYVQKGWLFKKRTAVAQNRIQHTDVEQGPFLRKYGLAQLILHTAGVKEADISISGLNYADAIAIRDHLLSLNKQKNNIHANPVTTAIHPRTDLYDDQSLKPGSESIASSVLELNQDMRE